MPRFYEFRPMVRWWWFGGAIERDEIEFQLEEMAKAGIGGVEIQPVYPLSSGRSGEPVNLRWLSKEFLDMIGFAVEKATLLGMTADLTLGSGWPFGGPHIPKKEAARKLRYDSWNLGAGETWRSEANPLEDDEELILLKAFPITKGFLDLDGSIDLAPEGEPPSEWTAPPGTWKVLRYASSFTRQMVKRATVGAEGWVADHFSLSAMERHFREVGDRLAEAGGGKVRCFFSDSWEVFGSNWTENFLEEFRRRRGYDLLPYLPALDNFIPDISPGVRFDFHRTLSDLVLESYIIPMRRWCNGVGACSRVQAHGTTPADVLKCYGESDIPECETGEGADGPGIRRTPKFASSAGHLYGRSAVSCEIFTHLRRPRFQVTPRMLKVAAERTFCHGVNQLVYHGYSYSPRVLGSPGWVFYASTMINHNNTWWSYLGHLNRWLARLAEELQRGESTADVLIYSSLAEVWSKKGRETRPSTLSLLSAQLGRLPEIIWGNGYDFDVANDEILSRVEVKGGRIVASGLEYSLLVIPEVELVSQEAVDAICRLVSDGAMLVFLNEAPSGSPVSPVASPSDMDRAAVGERLERAARGIGIALEDLVVSEGDLGRVLRERRDPDLQLPYQDPEISFIHRHLEGGEVYFLSNCGSGEKALEVSFRVRNLVPFEIDPQDGSDHQTCVYRREGGRTILRMSFEPFGSRLVVFRDAEEEAHLTRTDFPSVRRSPRGNLIGRAYASGRYSITDSKGRRKTVLAGDIPRVLRLQNWSLTVSECGLKRLKLPNLRSWTEIPELVSYSGTAKYETEFDLGKEYFSSGIGLELDLGKVFEVTTVFLNGKRAGDLWMPPYSLEISALCRKGKNLVEIDVKNLLVNKVLGMEDPDFSEVERTYGRRFPEPKEKKQLGPKASGILGPVLIRPHLSVNLP